MQLLAQGMTYRKIARALLCSEHTVDTHVRNIKTKLDLSGDRVNLVVWYYTRRDERRAA